MARTSYRDRIFREYYLQAEMQYDAKKECERLARRNEMYSYDRMRSTAKAHEIAMTALASCLTEADRAFLPGIRFSVADDWEVRVANGETHY